MPSQLVARLMHVEVEVAVEGVVLVEPSKSSFLSS
jgi:hypothetical protein